MSHIGNVVKSFHVLVPNLDLDKDTIDSLEKQISMHDKSKYSKEEFIPYMDYFYPEDPDQEKDITSFNYAWLHHITVNKHHWNHWILIEDTGKPKALDMPLNYIIEMLCDWQSFSAKNPDSTAYNWYKKNKDKMIISDKTRNIIEKYILFLEEPILRT
jgi:hypothetical protein